MVNFIKDRNTGIFECLDLTLDFMIDHFPLQLRGSYRMIGSTLQQVIGQYFRLVFFWVPSNWHSEPTDRMV